MPFQQLRQDSVASTLSEDSSNQLAKMYERLRQDSMASTLNEDHGNQLAKMYNKLRQDSVASTLCEESGDQQHLAKMYEKLRQDSVCSTLSEGTSNHLAVMYEKMRQHSITSTHSDDVLLGPSKPPASHRHRRRRERCTRRALLFLVAGILVVVFCAVFFPVYFVLHRPSSESASASGAGSQAASGSQSHAAAAVAGSVATTQGAVWQQAVNFQNLNDLNIAYYSSGRNNSMVLSGLPSSVQRRAAMRRQNSSSRSSSSRTSRSTATKSVTTLRTKSAASSSTTTLASSTATAAIPTQPVSDNSTVGGGGSVLQIYYPAGSYTPSAKPVGGTQFYAYTPFDLSKAASVTLTYSAYFPPGYNFVMGGKMPGLYGGTEGCGGGNVATNCWSTRMAWRTDGAGELYAYLPKDKQNVTAMLQVPPYSYVNPDYGITLGRGSFTWTRGQWTTISQTVTLSTNDTHPNGIVEIAVNGQRAIYYDQVYWPAGIKGILFSTFFGGNTKDWATPVDQYSYFKGFGVQINSLLPSTKS